MRRLLFQNVARGRLTEPPPAPDEAALAELAANLGRVARKKLGRSLAIREVDAGSAMPASSRSTRSTTPSTISSASACASSPRRVMPTFCW